LFGLLGNEGGYYRSKSGELLMQYETLMNR
jgi:hypothetical protein